MAGKFKKRFVISASRRTDIPAFYMDWFFDSVKRGRFEIINPYNRRKVTREITPDTVHSIVFWSKNFIPFLNKGYGDRLRKMGYNLFFNVTINSNDPILEPFLPDIEQKTLQLKLLADNFGPETINWRFDPVCFYKLNNKRHNNLNDFAYIADIAYKAKIRRCITSFVDIYKKISKRVSKNKGMILLDPPDEKKIDVVLRMEKILKAKGIDLSLCCESIILDSLPEHSDISRSSCIDNRLLMKLFGDGISLAKDTGQRTESGCDCKKSFDIGVYQWHPCIHSCLYCYANPATI